MELLLGCGNNREKRLNCGDDGGWRKLVTIDHDPNCGADILHDLTKLPYPFEDNTFEEIHAYEVLEHLGQQGDYETFFKQFAEFHRILKPGGWLAATCPSWKSLWAWGDPSHSRVINSGSIVFLSQKQYELQVGKTAMTDFRWLYKADFECTWMHEDENVFQFILRAIK